MNTFLFEHASDLMHYTVEVQADTLPEAVGKANGLDGAELEADPLGCEVRATICPDFSEDDLLERW